MITLLLFQQASFLHLSLELRNCSEEVVYHSEQKPASQLQVLKEGCFAMAITNISIQKSANTKYVKY